MRVPETYNRYVTHCASCGAELRFPEDAIGIGKPPFRAWHSEDKYAIIMECPVCFTKQWNHGDERTAKEVREYLKSKNHLTSVTEGRP